MLKIDHIGSYSLTVRHVKFPTSGKMTQTRVQLPSDYEIVPNHHFTITSSLALGVNLLRSTRPMNRVRDSINGIQSRSSAHMRSKGIGGNSSRAEELVQYSDGRENHSGRISSVLSTLVSFISLTFKKEYTLLGLPERRRMNILLFDVHTDIPPSKTVAFRKM